VPARRDRPGQCGRLPRGAAGGGVLDRPAADVHGRRTAVEELDEVAREGRAGVAAAGVDLAHDDVGRGAAGGRHCEDGNRDDEEEDVRYES